MRRPYTYCCGSMSVDRLRDNPQFVGHRGTAGAGAGPDSLTAVVHVIQTPAPRRDRRGAGRSRWLEVFRVLVGEDPGDLGGVAWVVGLLGAGRGAVTAEVLPVQAPVGEDGDQGAALAAQGDGLCVLGLVGGGGNRSERDLERLRVDHAQKRQRRLHLAGGGLRQSVPALARGRVGVRVRVLTGLGDDGLHDCSSSVVWWGGLGPSAVFRHLGGPPVFRLYE